MGFSRPARTASAPEDHGSGDQDLEIQTRGRPRLGSPRLRALAVGYKYSIHLKLLAKFGIDTAENGPPEVQGTNAREAWFLRGEGRVLAALLIQSDNCVSPRRCECAIFAITAESIAVLNDEKWMEN